MQIKYCLNCSCFFFFLNLSLKELLSLLKISAAHSYDVDACCRVSQRSSSTFSFNHYFCFLFNLHNEGNRKDHYVSPPSCLACVNAFKCLSSLPQSSDINAVLFQSPLKPEATLLGARTETERRWHAEQSLSLSKSLQVLSFLFFFGLLEITLHLYLESFLV